MANKKKVGRPPKYDTPEQLQDKIDEYIKGDDKDKLTITGLCLHCGFESRQSFYAYEQKEKFSYTIKRSRLFIENAYEKRLQDRNPTGSIFALKNLGWTDKQEIDHTTKGDKIELPFNIIIGSREKTNFK